MSEEKRSFAEWLDEFKRRAKNAPQKNKKWAAICFGSIVLLIIFWIVGFWLPW